MPERVSGPPPPPQGQHFRLWTVPEAQHLGASRLVSAGRGSTSGSGRCPSAFRAPPPLDAARRSTWEPRGSFLLAGAALQALDGARARFGAPPLDAARRSFLLAGAALQALDGARARFGAPRLDAARRSTWEPRDSFLLAGAALEALDASRARFGAPPLDAARRSTWEPRGSPVLMQHLGASRLVSAARGSTSGSGLVAARTHVDTHIITIGSPQAVSVPALAFGRFCRPSGLLVSASA